MKFLAVGKNRSHIHKAILQGPVSDREYLATQPTTKEYLERALKFISAGQKTALISNSDDSVSAPITAYRFHSLASYLGDDDMFSSDIPAEKLKGIFQHISIPTLWVFSCADQYVPSHVDINKLAQTIHSVVANSEILLLEKDRHEIDVSVERFLDTVVKFLR